LIAPRACRCAMILIPGPDAARFAVSAGMATMVYADPYQTNVNRSTTEMETSGVQLTWDGIMGSGFGVEIAVKQRDIDHENSGQAL